MKSVYAPFVRQQYDLREEFGKMAWAASNGSSAMKIGKSGPGTLEKTSECVLNRSLATPWLNSSEKTSPSLFVFQSTSLPLSTA